MVYRVIRPITENLSDHLTKFLSMDVTREKYNRMEVSERSQPTKNSGASGTVRHPPGHCGRLRGGYTLVKDREGYSACRWKMICDCVSKHSQDLLRSTLRALLVAQGLCITWLASLGLWGLSPRSKPCRKLFQQVDFLLQRLKPT